MIITVADGVQVEAAYPTIQWEHVDGPYIDLTDATIHWLSIWERMLLSLKLMDVEDIDRARSSLPNEIKDNIYKKLKPVQLTKGKR